MSKQLSRDNHYIPQMYLRNWSKDGKNISLYNILVSHNNVPFWTTRSIEYTGFRNNLYTRIEDEKEYDDFEQRFNYQFEDPCKNTLRKACQGEELSHEEWRQLIDFMAVQYVRTPAFYQKIHNSGNEILPQVLDEVCKKLENIKEIPKVTREDVEYGSLLPLEVNIKEKENPDEPAVAEISTYNGKGMWLIFLENFFRDDSMVRNAFHNLKWSIADAPKNKMWPTSDNPVVIGRKKNGYYVISDGFLDKRNFYLFPLSPEKLLIGTKNRKYKRCFTADEKLYDDIVELILKNAHLGIYGYEEDDIIPTIRKRVVNEKEYKRVTKEFDEWYDTYKETEGTMLKSRDRRFDLEQ